MTHAFLTRCLLIMCPLSVFAQPSPDISPPALSTMGSSFRDAADVCRPVESLPRPLNLAAAVERALCANPRTAQAWAWTQRDAAQVDVARGAYLPQVQASGSLARVSQDVRYSDIDGFDSSLKARSSTVGLNLNWVLYDFGLRAAELERARQLLNAASAAHSQVIQEVFRETADAFHAAQAAQAAVIVRQEAEAVAAQSFEVADGRRAAGVGSPSDRLLARTRFDQARLARIRAEGDSREAVGALATLLGLRADTPIILPGADTALSTTFFTAAVDELIDMAMSVHPEIRAASAQVQAAHAAADAARAGGRPSISLFASMDRRDTPIEQVSSPQVIENASIGVQISIPLFSGFQHHNRWRAALAETRAREQELAETRHRIAQAVWQAYQAVHSESEQVSVTQTLVSTANESLDVVRGRYKAGVGGILELLEAQQSAAMAREEHIATVARWHSARLALGASLASLHIDRLPSGAGSFPAN